MTDETKLLTAFEHQCECNLSYVPEKDKAVVEIGQGHLLDQFKALLKTCADQQAECAKYKALALHRGRQMAALEPTVSGICDQVESEGDRTYFGSTNDADRLSDLALQLQETDWEIEDPESFEPDFPKAVNVLTAKVNELTGVCIDLQAELRQARSGEDGDEPQDSAEMCEGLDRLQRRVLSASPERYVISPQDIPALHRAVNYARRDPMLLRDAERWRALLASERVRMMGSAGFTYPEGTTQVHVADSDNPQLHLGLELWNRHPDKHPSSRFPQDRCRNLLVAYVDSIREKAFA